MPSQAKRVTHDQVHSDRLLVNRCVAGETSAWEELYDQHHDGILLSLKLMFGRRSWDPNLLEEIACRVWYAVVQDEARVLNRFDPDRGCRLSTYLATIARSEAMNFFRSERRRRNRERVAAARTSPVTEGRLGEWTLGDLNDFLKKLTPRESEFLNGFLLDRNGNGNGQTFSDTNRWQLTRRVQKKLRSFVSGEVG